MLTVITSDNEQFTIEKDVAARSALLGDMAENESSEPVPLFNVSSAVLKKVLEHCEHHRNDALSSATGSGPTTVLSDWDKAFFAGVDREMLFQIIIAANFLNIKQLLEGGTKTVSEMIRGMNPQQIRELFNIQGPAPPDQQAVPVHRQQ
ncbi:hypothetical protein HGRIS_012890 [Hohenbuehelia grisea]|uniref:E3 ubiquitin ligase complex SCF subunit n=1 Tax=Hohenbuehelia grisea TaxID=104357 RepID=A0ABR3ITU5_9AGAR